MKRDITEINVPTIMEAKRFRDGVYNKKLYQSALNDALIKIKANVELFIDRYPHVSVNNIYSPEENKLWTSSFFAGITYLAFEITGNKSFIKYSDEYLKCFQWRLEEGHTVTHDLGFLYTLSCVANYKLTGNIHAMNIAVKAADVLIKRYNEKGEYIQAWGEIGIKYPNVKIIIDTMLNLPLLYWASEVTKDKKYYEIAINHAYTAAAYLIRDDASSYHTFLMDPETGRAVEGKTHQGKSDESTWARGQGWAVYGFALSYRYTKDPYFLEVSKKTANYFINNLPEDFVPYWDFSYNDKDPDIKDSSAACIFLCGLLELVKYTVGEEKGMYLKVVYKIIASLHTNYSTRNESDSNGLILEGMYHRDDGANNCTIWGDYFYFEALVRLLKDWDLYW